MRNKIILIIVAVMFVCALGWYAVGSQSKNIPDVPAVVTQTSTSTNLFSETTYKILTPRKGDSFPDGEPSITITWEPFDDSQYVDIYILPDICTDEPCFGSGIEYTDKGLENQGSHKNVKDTGSYTFVLGTSSYLSFFMGNYRVALFRTSEKAPNPQTFLAVSDSFALDTLMGNNIGDRVGDLIITSVSDDGISTTGTTTVRGTFEYLAEYDPNCFEVITDDAWKIPHIIEREMPYFCFNNDIPDELRNSKSTTTIQIANYNVNARAIEATDRADFVRIVH